MRSISRFAALTLMAAPSLSAQARTLTPAMKPYVSVDAPVVAIIHAKLIDGSGAPAKADQTIIIKGENIAQVGAGNAVMAPAGATVIDARGKTVIPGIIGLHDHMYYGGMKFMGVSYPR